MSSNIDFHGTGTSGTVNLPPGAPRGDQFAFTGDVRLLGLRVFTALDGGSGFTLTLWDMNQNKLAQGSVAASAGAWTTYTLPSSLILTGGQKYLLTAYSTSSRAGGTGSTSVHTHTVDQFSATYYGYFYASGGDANTFPPNGPSTANEYGVGVVVTTLNTAPNAPTLTSPATNATLDRSITQRFAWDFSDPDTGDSQSKFDLQYRTVGASTWTAVSGTTPNTYWDAAAGTFAAGDYEWQVRTYDAQGVIGPWSPSSFFTAADTPAPATITDPVNGQTISQASYEAVISAPDVDASEWRTVADDGAGNADPSTIYSTTVTKTTGDLRRHTFDFPVNNRVEHLQSRIKKGGLWSTWADSRNPISYTPPTTPTFTLASDAATGSIAVAITNPTPGAGQPAVSYNEVWVNDGSGEERRATNLPTNTSWTYWTPVSGRDYAANVRVVAVASNGTTASS